MPMQTSTRHQPAGSDIPDKLYFRIGEVARICEVPAYVLRFWESEFQQLKPKKSGTGQRLYRKTDVEISLRIKQLLYDEGYTIPGARQVFQAEAKEYRNRAKAPELPLPVPASNASTNRLEKVRKELRELVGLLSAPIGEGYSKRQDRTGRNTSDSKPAALFEL